MQEGRWWRAALVVAWLGALNATYLNSTAFFSVRLRIAGIIVGLLSVSLGLVSYRRAHGDPTWWRATLLSAWCAGLIWSLVYGTFSVVGGILAGALAVGIGMLGYRAVGGSHNLFWRVQLASMLPLGVFLCLHPLADWRNGVPQTWLTIPLGLLFVIATGGAVAGRPAARPRRATSVTPR